MTVRRPTWRYTFYAVLVVDGEGRLQRVFECKDRARALEEFAKREARGEFVWMWRVTEAMGTRLRTDDI